MSSSASGAHTRLRVVARFGITGRGCCCTVLSCVAEGAGSARCRPLDRAGVGAGASRRCSPSVRAGGCAGAGGGAVAGSGVGAGGGGTGGRGRTHMSSSSEDEIVLITTPF